MKSQTLQEIHQGLKFIFVILFTTTHFFEETSEMLPFIMSGKWDGGGDGGEKE